MSLKITKVLLLDNVDPAAKEILEANGIATLCKEKFTAPALISELQSYDGVVVRSATKVTSEILEACPNLNIIGRAGTGVDNIDVKAATKHGVAVMNTPGGNTISAAEHTCTLLCSLSRNVPAADAHVKAGKWDRKAFMGNELFGKVLAIVGLGRIGIEVAQRMQSFGMKTIGYDPLVSADTAKEYNVEWMELDKIWPQADYITVHTPLIPQTRGLLNTESFGKCKSGVRVVNCARGGIIDEDSLLKALESGICGGAGLDVFVDEPTKNMALVSHPKVVACPHLGASTKEGQARCGREIAEQFVSARDGINYFGIINAPALSADCPTAWADVTKCLSTVIKKYMKDSKFNLTLSTSGCELAKLGRPLKAAVCCGILGEEANLISAPSIAEELGIEVSIKHETGDSAECILTGKSETTTLQLNGDVRSGKPVLTGINKQILPVAFEFAGCILLYKAMSSANRIPEVVNALSSKGVDPQAMSISQAFDGFLWVAMKLSKFPEGIDYLKTILENPVLLKF
uniref:LOW QUALITY PROTEIN: D-3-phosphoglycerate dehydrogenase-like n=1 Tax=Styela clava TaxID=7725 RepID=UPI00193A970A|nr:LOW QUALITY PROTEIN: D-3-phosphoglycerate dehydrogenase-like [Styela clava]